MDADDPAFAALRCSEVIGRPLGDGAFQNEIARRLGRVVTPRKRGRKSKAPGDRYRTLDDARRRRRKPRHGPPSLKVNTAKHRTHSLFRQGCMLYELIPNMPEVRLRPLAQRFSEYINQNKALTKTFAFV